MAVSSICSAPYLRLLVWFRSTGALCSEKKTKSSCLKTRKEDPRMEQYKKRVIWQWEGVMLLPSAWISPASGTVSTFSMSEFPSNTIWVSSVTLKRCCFCGRGKSESKQQGRFCRMWKNVASGCVVLLVAAKSSQSGLPVWEQGCPAKEVGRGAWRGNTLDQQSLNGWSYNHNVNCWVKMSIASCNGTTKMSATH